MSIPKNINRDHLLSAIQKIDLEGIPKDADSQYYDVVFNEKHYPPKLIVSYANLFANGEILDRKLFEGGLNTECFNLLELHGFKIESKSKQQNNRNVWLVMQGTTFNNERGKKFLFAPSKSKNGNPPIFHWKNVSRIKSGDIIFNYSKKEIKGVSIAISDAYDYVDPNPNPQWENTGYRVDIDITELVPPISSNLIQNNINKINELLKPIANKPFNSKGGGNQGYLYEFTKEAGKFIGELYGKPFGNKIIDDFFNNVQNEIKVTKDDRQFSDYNSFISDSKNANYIIDENLSWRYIASLITKPFVILTGLSGSGKTKLAQAFAYWIAENDDQYKLIPVGADWTNRDPLLGYINALEDKKYILPENGALQLIIEAKNNRHKPYFLILDEMNLSHVERYFADFLSALESKEMISLHPDTSDWDGIPSALKLPDNLFVIGTVNVDETTYMFSPKVLDRANVIEFRVTKKEMEEFLNDCQPINLDSLKGKGSHLASVFMNEVRDSNLSIQTDLWIKTDLVYFFEELKKLGSEFGYRTAAEIMKYCVIAKKVNPNLTNEKVLDSAIMQKLLPKVHGSRRKLEPKLKSMAKICVYDDSKLEEWMNSEDYLELDNNPNVKYSISLEKIIRMYKILISNSFASYAEA